MTERHYGSSIVVGVDGSSQAKAAVDWAASWAMARGNRLILLVGVGPDPTAYSPLLGNRYFDEVVKAGNEVADLATEDARNRHPGLQISHELSEASPAAALVHASKSAAAVVMGAQGRGRSTKLPLGGVADAVTRHATCPVVVVPEHARHAQGPITLGIDASEHCRPAAEFAFAEADRRGVELNLVHGYKGEFTWGSMHDETHRHSQLKSFLAELKDKLDDWTAPVAANHPKVKQNWHLENDYPINAVAHVGRHSAMTVMGNRGRGGFTGLVLGSTSRGLLELTHSPVAIIRG